MNDELITQLADKTEQALQAIANGLGVTNELTGEKLSAKVYKRKKGWYALLSLGVYWEQVVFKSEEEARAWAQERITKVVEDGSPGAGYTEPHHLGGAAGMNWEEPYPKCGGKKIIGIEYIMT